MAVSLAQVGRRTVFGDRRVAFFTVTFDNSFTDEGEVLTPAMCGLQSIDLVVAEAAHDLTTTDTAYVLTYDYTNSKLLAFNSGTADAGLNEGDAEDLSGFTARIMVIGL
jgi:hypothetical protein